MNKKILFCVSILLAGCSLSGIDAVEMLKLDLSNIDYVDFETGVWSSVTGRVYDEEIQKKTISFFSEKDYVLTEEKIYCDGFFVLLTDVINNDNYVFSVSEDKIWLIQIKNDSISTYYTDIKDSDYQEFSSLHTKEIYSGSSIHNLIISEKLSVSINRSDEKKEPIISIDSKQVYPKLEE